MTICIYVGMYVCRDIYVGEHEENTEYNNSLLLQAKCQKNMCELRMKLYNLYFLYTGKGFAYMSACVLYVLHVYIVNYVYEKEM